MAASRVVQNEVCIAIRALLAGVPSLSATPEQRSAFQLRKAEVLDLLAATDPVVAAEARQLAARARYEARAIASEY
jgi:DTW domain-containing protein YfiP